MCADNNIRFARSANAHVFRNRDDIYPHHVYYGGRVVGCGDLRDKITPFDGNIVIINIPTYYTHTVFYIVVREYTIICIRSRYFRPASSQRFSLSLRAININARNIYYIISYLFPLANANITNIIYLYILYNNIEATTWDGPEYNTIKSTRAWRFVYTEKEKTGSCPSDVFQKNNNITEYVYRGIKHTILYIYIIRTRLVYNNKR